MTAVAFDFLQLNSIISCGNIFPWNLSCGIQNWSWTSIAIIVREMMAVEFIGAWETVAGPSQKGSIMEISGMGIRSATPVITFATSHY